MLLSPSGGPQEIILDAVDGVILTGIHRGGSGLL